MAGNETFSIDDAEAVQLPLRDVMAGRGFITGKSGAGKSNSASVVAEEILERGRPVLIVDTDGEYWGLKDTYEILHVGAGEDVDHEVGSEHAEWLAEKALVDGIPVILDVSGYIDTDEANEIVQKTVHHLFVKEKEERVPFLVLVEEIHEYIPQSGALDEVGKVLLTVAKRGRKRGLGLLGLSQRPASVDKDFITQADWMMWHRLTWDNDTNVVRSVVGPDVASEVSDLDNGEGFLVADFLEEDVVRVQVRRKRTFDAAETPDLEDRERPELKSLGGDLSEELQQISRRQQKRRDEVERLKGVIESREETISELEDELERERIATSTAERIADAVAGGSSNEDVQEKIEEIRQEKNEEIRTLKTDRQSLQETLDDLRGERDDLERRVDELEEMAAIDANIDELEEAMERMNEALGLDVSVSDDKLRERLREREEKIEELQSRLSRAQVSASDVNLGDFEEYEDFLDSEPVREAIESAKEEAVPRYVSGVLSTIVDEGGPVTYKEVAERLGIKDTVDISKAATRLETKGVVKKTRVDGSRAYEVDLNLGGIEEIIRKREKQKRTEDLMERI